MTYAFLATNKVSSNSVSYDTILADNPSRFVLEEGVFAKGEFENQPYQITIIHPDDSTTAFNFSEKIVQHQSMLGIQNFKQRSQPEIADNLSISLTPEEEKGGLVVGLHLKDSGRLLAMGGVVQIVEENDGGRGINFNGCALNQQTIMNMAGTDPEVQGLGLTSMILPHRFNIALKIAEAAKHRTHIVTKIAFGTSTYNFYTNKVGLQQCASKNEPNPNGQDTLLTTLAGHIDVVRSYMEYNHADILKQDFDLYSLHEYRKNPVKAAAYNAS